MEETRQTIIDREFKAYHRREDLNENLGHACFLSLARHPFRKLIVDYTRERRELPSGKLLAVSIAASRHWSKTISGRRVGIVLPPGMGGFITNLAVVLCGKVPVNLNFTAGPQAITASIRKAGIETIISAEAIKEKVPDFPWIDDTRDLVAELQGLGKKVIIGWLLAILLLPASFLARRLGIPRHGGDEEAAVLFSSGSTGEPKGVILTHRNIIGNCLQIADCNLLHPDEILLACLPIFHSFGFTATLWYPLISGMKTVTTPSPLEVKKIASIIKAEKATVLMSTPTFYRPYFKKVSPEDIKSLKYVVGGAEKTPDGFKDKWEKYFGSLYLEGYGITETSPGISCNLPIPPPDSPGTGMRDGSVGLLFPGMSARIVDPDTGKPMSPFETGMLQVRGPNVFPGYLDDTEKTEAAFDGDWYITGDLARFDGDGFLFIEGRLSRFSKIAGEMVPHGTVEERVADVLGLKDSETPMVAVAGVSDEVRGEAIVLISAVEVTLDNLRQKLVEAGLPKLWVPRIIKQVDKIPCLGTGKLDLKALAQIASE